MARLRRDRPDTGGGSLVMSLRVLMPLLACAVMLAPPACAQEASAAKSGFVFPRDGPVRILVFRPDVRVGEQSTGGLNEPNAD